MTKLHRTIEHLQSGGVPFCVATVVRAVAPTSAKPGDKAVVTADGTVHGWVGGSCAEPTVKREVTRALEDGETRLVHITPESEHPEGRDGLVVVPMTCYSGGTLEIYIEPHLAKPHLVVFGNSPVAAALVTLSDVMGFRSTVVDLTERPAMDGASTVRSLEAVEVSNPSETYVVIATHGVFDEDAIARAVALRPAYLGMVSSRKRFASVRNRLLGRGLTASALDLIRAPAGLDLGGGTPEQIALSVLAEITALQLGRDRKRDPAPVQASPMPAETDETSSCCGSKVADAG